jgi:hypothetical protein
MHVFMPARAPKLPPRRPYAYATLLAITMLAVHDTITLVPCPEWFVLVYAGVITALAAYLWRTRGGR